MRNLYKLLLLICVLLTAGCQTYHVTTESLLVQFAQTNPEYKKVNIAVTGAGRVPFIFVFPWPYAVNGNDLREITVLDKNGNEHIIPVNQHTGVRITRQNGSHTTFYFNTLLISDSFISGNKTHFFNAPIKKIHLAEIKKIEIQK